MCSDSPSAPKQQRVGYNKRPMSDLENNNTSISKIEYLHAYRVFELVDRAIDNHKPLPFDEIHLIGSKFSGKTYSAVQCLCSNARDHDNVESRFHRYKQTDIRDFAYDVRAKLNKIGIFGYSVVGFDTGRNTRMIFPNGNRIEIESTETPRKKELGSTGGTREFSKEYGFDWFEEMFEYPERNYVETIGTQRGCKYYCAIHSSNPWRERSWYVRKILHMLPWNERLMELRGLNAIKLTIKENKYGVETEKRICIIWTNWRVNKMNLNQKDMIRIMSYYDISEQAGLCADLGKAGSESTGIYIDRMNKIKTNPTWQRAERIGGGGDIGTGKSAHAGITAFVFGLWTHDHKHKILDKFKWDMRKNHIPIPLLYDMIIDFYIRNVMEYVKITKERLDRIHVEVRVDLSNQEFIDNLNICASERGCYWMEFVPCLKLPIWDRIIAEWKEIDNANLEIDINNVPEMFDEMEASEWVEIEGKRERKNAKDHFLNAYEYFIEPEMAEGLMSENNISNQEDFWVNTKF